MYKKLLKIFYQIYTNILSSFSETVSKKFSICFPVSTIVSNIIFSFPMVKLGDNFDLMNRHLSPWSRNKCPDKGSFSSSQYIPRSWKMLKSFIKMYLSNSGSYKQWISFISSYYLVSFTSYTKKRITRFLACLKIRNVIWNNSSNLLLWFKTTKIIYSFWNPRYLSQACKIFHWGMLDIWELSQFKKERKQESHKLSKKSETVFQKKLRRRFIW